MDDRVFFEEVERRLLRASSRLKHESFSGATNGRPWQRHAAECERCQIEKLAEESADRAAKLRVA